MVIVWVPAVAVTDPPGHVVLALGVGAMTTPSVVLPGNTSVRDTLLTGEAFVFCSEIESVDIPPGMTVGGVNALLIVTGVTACTVRSAVILFGIDLFCVLVMSRGCIVFV